MAPPKNNTNPPTTTNTTKKQPTTLTTKKTVSFVTPTPQSPPPPPPTSTTTTKDNDMHESFLDFKESIFNDWRKAGIGLTIVYIIGVLLLLPFFVSPAVVVICMIPFIPLAYVYGWIEHKLPYFWFVIFSFVIIGGLGDSVSDVMLLVEGIKVLYFGGGGTTFDNDQDSSLFFVRLAITFIGPVLAFIVDVKIFTYGTKQKDQSSMMGAGSLAVILYAIFWKAFVIVARVFYFGRVVYLAIKEKTMHFSKSDVYKNHLIETQLLLDFIFVSFPLGILTLLEITMFGKELDFGSETFWELFKLTMLVIDMFGLTYFVYFIILGYSRRFFHHHGHHNHDEEHHSHHGHVQKESQPLLKDDHIV
ncbi:hypothetical protein DFA_07337 [Cavenderia fasciculata]|uniref:Transmembrane protein n=1 Tax=Cavenderia fasciculata TaxID=261658 RepID=F4PW52_CACFS|nr:uncharacterized protein DFA_07337 [Cavenderia fasciculata]EGG20216.1 hypothetical protein DFA_07337 [Cavenderia fasciculata]|eukprot:XP_004367199.1 hypothetical protein DFA_07337 [Cavenderia fasciculata]